MKYRALIIEDSEDRVRFIDLEESDLPDKGDALVRVHWSSVNYKDALAVTGKGKIIRAPLPFVPGIDLAGTILHSSNPRFEKGSRVLGTGWGIGENHWGGYSQIQRVSSDFLVPLPSGLSLRDAMIIGTAGLTAMLSVLELEKHGLAKGDGRVLVTGATGGVGSFAVRLLSEAGFTVVASTGKESARDYLMNLGAAEVIDRSELSKGASRPLDRGEWSGCVDSVGSKTLEAVLSQCCRHAVVAACGLAAGPELNTSVFPFILRGIKLIGIDSNTCPNSIRSEAWERLCSVADQLRLDSIATEIELQDVPAACSKLMAGEMRGRYLVNLSD